MMLLMEESLDQLGHMKPTIKEEIYLSSGADFPHQQQ